MPEFSELYRQEETYDPANNRLEHYAPGCYDHLWVSALALNCTDAYMKTTGTYVGYFLLTDVL